jgi:predicted O-linked N-acetylglucosamine transferase (SPINDLY family)
MAHAQTLNFSQTHAVKLLNQLKQWRAKKEPLLTERLLAYPEDNFYETHTQPQQALLALSELFSINAQAIHGASRAGVSVDALMKVDPEHMSSLMAILARSMTANTCSVDYAASLRTMHQDIAEEAHHENTH